MIRRSMPLALLTLALVGCNVYAQSPAAAPPLPRYPELRTHFNESLSHTTTNEQRLEFYRQIVAQGRYSGRPMLMRMFKNFARDSFKLSPTTPGLSTTVRLLASDNPNVVKGHARMLVYANSIEEDGRFHVIGLNQPRVSTAGRTDADIVFRHKDTGLQVRMEVKNMTPASQLANLGKIQAQILKMAQDARRTGEMQVFVNRHNVIPEVRAFAEQHGVRVVERLRTGNSNVRPGDRSFQDFADGLDKELRVQARLTAVAGSVRAGMGLYLAYQAFRGLTTEIADFSGTQGNWLRVGQHGSTLLAGGGLCTAGVAQLASQVPALANSARLLSLTRWGSRLGVAGIGLAEGFLVVQYLSGDLPERRFWHDQASLCGGLAGGVAGSFAAFKAGALVGGAIGSLFGPGGMATGASIGGTIGGIAGGLGGNYAGAHFAGRWVESRYRLRDVEQQERYFQFLLQHYKSCCSRTGQSRPNG